MAGGRKNGGGEGKRGGGHKSVSDTSNANASEMRCGADDTV